MTKTWILMPLANDADKNQSLKKYTGLGPNSKQRIEEAVRWAEEKIPIAEKVWIFGAGTHPEWHLGQTLGVWAETYLRMLLKNPLSVISNHFDKNFYGTYEEMKWGVKALLKRHHPGTVVFVFFGPSWHLLRARLIWRLFFKREWGSARFVKTNDGALPSWPHEIAGYLKVVAHKIAPNLVKTRDQTPYPSTVDEYGIEC